MSNMAVGNGMIIMDTIPTTASARITSLLLSICRHRGVADAELVVAAIM
jgi:hypothetical protein